MIIHPYKTIFTTKIKNQLNELHPTKAIVTPVPIYDHFLKNPYPLKRYLHTSYLHKWIIVSHSPIPNPWKKFIHHHTRNQLCVIKFSQLVSQPWRLWISIEIKRFIQGQNIIFPLTHQNCTPLFRTIGRFGLTLNSINSLYYNIYLRLRRIILYLTSNIILWNRLPITTH